MPLFSQWIKITLMGIEPHRARNGFGAASFAAKGKKKQTIG